MTYPTIYRVLQYKRPVCARPELGETVVQHADMLRYDLAFHHPKDPSLVIFPLFRAAHVGTMPNKITVARWDSFSMTMEPVAVLGEKMDVLQEQALPEGVNPFRITNLDDWIGFVIPENQRGLGQITLGEFLDVRTDWKISGFRAI